MCDGGVEAFAVGGELGDLVEEDLDGDLGADGQGRVVDPFSGHRGNCPGAEQDTVVGVGEQPEVEEPGDFWTVISGWFMLRCFARTKSAPLRLESGIQVRSGA